MACLQRDPMSERRERAGAPEVDELVQPWGPERRSSVMGPDEARPHTNVGANRPGELEALLDLGTSAGRSTWRPLARRGRARGTGASAEARGCGWVAVERRERRHRRLLREDWKILPFRIRSGTAVGATTCRA